MESHAYSPWKPTSKNDLINILRKCPLCFKSTSYGDFIVYFHDLLSLPSKKLVSHKIANIIVNAHYHWFLITIFWRQKCLVVSDSQQSVSTNENVMKYITQFSQKHMLKPFFFSVNYQLLHHHTCGPVSVALLAIINSTSSLLKFTKLRKRFSKNSTGQNEKYLLKLLKNHFKLH